MKGMRLTNNPHLIVGAGCLFLTLLIFTPSYSQYHKEKCLVGNCKNGYGLNRIEGNKKNPLPFDLSSPWTNGYQYYEVGEFKSGVLTGNGYRVALQGIPQTAEIWLTNLIKNKEPLPVDARHCTWYEGGMYDKGLLNGKGALIEFGYDGPRRIREGTFKNSLLNGEGIKIIPTQDGFFKTEVDQDGKYKVLYGRLFHGNFINDVCTDCSITETKVGGGEGTTWGKLLQEDFLSGWVTKNYETDSYSGKFKSTEPYKALIIGGVEVARLPSTETTTNIKTVSLPDGTSYTGEVDDKGNAYGFGTIVLSGSPDAYYNYLVYEGFVDNGKPEGWGYRINRNNPLDVIMGGFYKNNILMHGVLVKPNDGPQVIQFGEKSGNLDPHYNAYLKSILDGPFFQRTYTYDANSRTFRLSREESGYKVNGYEKNVWVSKGQTMEEKKRQRVVTNGMISISDLTVSDIVVLNGMASPIVTEGAGIFELKNGKKVSSLTGNQVQLSRHPASDFHQACKECKGSGQMTYSYQPPPQQVEVVNYSYSTEVLDYTAWRKTTKTTTTYTKTFPVEQRKKNCDACQGKGHSMDVTEIVE